MERFKGRGVKDTVDWTMVICYLLLVFIGWMNIYASVQSSEAVSIFDFSSRSGKQFVWMMTAFVIAALILFVINPKIYESASLLIYIGTVCLLVAVIFLGVEVKGSRSWFAFGPIRFQPAEISKISTSLMIAAVMSQVGYKLRNLKDFLITAAVILVPMAIIVAQSETGSALVYVGFAFVLYREGLSGWLLFLIGIFILLFITTLTVSPYASMLILICIVTLCNTLYYGKLKRWAAIVLPFLIVMSLLPWGQRELVTAISASPDSFLSKIRPEYILLGISCCSLPYFAFKAYRERNAFKWLSIAAFIASLVFIFSVDFIFHDVLQDHQRKRIEVLLGMKEDPTGVGYNVNQSMIAIGSGGMFGKGFLHGTQTTYGFVPEQSTDFIFCTVGEEWGFVGCAIVILLYTLLIWKIIQNAEKSREAFTRIYGYCVASCIFMHLFINIGMTIGIMPVIGIPLPFVSYGGSSLWAFTALLFIFIALVRNERRYF